MHAGGHRVISFRAIYALIMGADMGVVRQSRAVSSEWLNELPNVSMVPSHNVYLIAEMEDDDVV
jgi:hypothetical protein